MGSMLVSRTGLSSAMFAWLVSCSACSEQPCGPEMGKRAEPGDASLYAYWTPNALPLRLVVDPTESCPRANVEAAVSFWADHGGFFDLVEGRYRDGKDREYAHVYLHTGEPRCPTGPCIGHTQLSAVAPGRGMYASITVSDCSVETLAHELGHALGLDETTRPGAMMNVAADRAGWDVSAGEEAQLAYACESKQ